MDPAGRPAPRRRRPLVGAALVLGAATFWATFGIFAKFLYAAGYAPLELASVRAFVGFACVAAIAAPSLVRGTGARVAVRALPFFAAYGILGFATFTLVFLAALERTSVSIGVALLYTAPAFVVVLSAVLWKERFGRLRLVSLALVLAGVVLVTGAAGAVVRGTAPLSPPALLLGLGAGLGYATYTLFSKVATERHGPVASLFWSFAFAAAALTLFASPLPPLTRSPSDLPLLLGLGIVPTILPYALFLAGLRELRASTASMLASVEPAIAAIMAALLLAERIEALQVGGIVMVTAAAVMLARTEAE